MDYHPDDTLIRNELGYRIWVRPVGGVAVWRAPDGSLVPHYEALELASVFARRRRELAGGLDVPARGRKEPK